MRDPRPAGTKPTDVLIVVNLKKSGAVAYSGFTSISAVLRNANVNFSVPTGVDGAHLYGSGLRIRLKIKKSHTHSRGNPIVRDPDGLSPDTLTITDPDGNTVDVPVDLTPDDPCAGTS
jgi:hypothetical protein